MKGKKVGLIDFEGLMGIPHLGVQYIWEHIARGQCSSFIS